MSSPMVSIDINKLPSPEAYRLLIGAIVPRPIAWVSTVSKTGVQNLAPFSFFNGVCSNPPSLLFCPVNHPDGREKDTLRNVRETGEFVVNIATVDLAEQMNLTSGNFPPEINEFKEAGLTELKSIQVKPPRVKESPIQIECKLIQIVPVGPDPDTSPAGAGFVVIGRMVQMHLNEDVYKDGKVSMLDLQAIGRMAGAYYCKTDHLFELKRPLSG